MSTVYLSIGNSDDGLTQREWSEFWIAMAAEVVSLAAETHGAWFSNPAGPWQNACWCLEFSSEAAELTARDAATGVRKRFRQDSVAWATARTEFL